MTISSILSEWGNELHSTLLSNNSFCIALFSIDQKLLYANDPMNALFKIEPHESLINPSFDKLISLDNSKSLIFEGFLTLGDNSSVNTSIWAQVYRKENKLLIMGGVNAAQLLEQNQTMHKLNREVSNLQRELIKEKHALEATLKQYNEANKELEERNKSKDRFISILAHDLKNPFNSILGFLSILSKNIRNYSIDKIEKQIQIVNGSAKNTYTLLEEILTWARAQSDKTPFNPVNFDLLMAYDMVLENIKLSAINKNITINQVDLDKHTVFADIEMINTILRNLISNAIKFTEKGGTVSVSAKQENSHITISVSDNGIGIKEKILNKLFDISEKVTTQGTAQETGSGLGLLLCKEFVEKHNGKIWAESEEGKGSTFFFTIPK